MTEVTKIAVSKIFHNVNYIIPIYQRNYAWDELQIEQLLEDICDHTDVDNNDDSYFLGTLIVNQTDNVLFEVIDGQQRLTTLFLITRALGINYCHDALSFEARKKSNYTLSNIKIKEIDSLNSDLSSPEILNGWNIINRFLNRRKINREQFAKLLEKVFIVRVPVPKKIDLNHYFEIMNTRGEQLELHEIAKAKLLSEIGNHEEKAFAAMIWDACSDMNSYIQMNFDIKFRDVFFTSDWSSLSNELDNFDKLFAKLASAKLLVAREKIVDQTLSYKLEYIKEIDKSKSLNQTNDENERFESAISFPNFLLQVNSAIRVFDTKENNTQNENTEDSLDDKKLLKTLEHNWKNETAAKNYLYYLLVCRVLFDKYVIKREFASDYKEVGKWSLKCIINTNKNYYYRNTFSNTADDDSIDNQKIRTLQACLRVTYTSPKSMHWITIILSECLRNDSVNIIKHLENYCREKVKDADYKTKEGFGIERIVFTYLDYLLYRDGYSYNGKEVILAGQLNWQFQFRTSIEHFFPQNPDEVGNWGDNNLHMFGNLALVTVSGNSRFSNLVPSSKIKSYPSIINQSLKLKVMSEMIDNGNSDWTQDEASKHQEEMFKLIEKDINYKT